MTNNYPANVRKYFWFFKIKCVLLKKNKMIIKKYFSMIKFAHTIFALPFAMVGFCLGVADSMDNGELRIENGEWVGNILNSQFSILNFLLVILCMVFARNAAMGFNRYADRFIDAKNPRTEKREIPAGSIKPRSALIFVIVNAVAFVVTCWFINDLVFYLSPVALLVILGYSLTKKYTALCHFVLGAGLSLAPIGAYLAVTGKFALLPVMFSFVVFFWTAGFDIIYALQDKDFDIKERLYSIPALLGIRKAMLVSAAAHIVVGILVVITGVVWSATPSLSGRGGEGYFGIWYTIGALIFLFLLLYQHLIVKPNDLSRINAAFFTSNGIASVLYSTFTIIDMFM